MLHPLGIFKFSAILAGFFVLPISGSSLTSLPSYCATLAVSRCTPRITYFCAFAKNGTYLEDPNCGRSQWIPGGIGSRKPVRPVLPTQPVLPVPPVLPVSPVPQPTTPVPSCDSSCCACPDKDCLSAAQNKTIESWPGPRCPNPFIANCDLVEGLLNPCSADSDCQNDQLCCPSSCTKYTNICWNKNFFFNETTDSHFPTLNSEKCPKTNKKPCNKDVVKFLTRCQNDLQCPSGKICCSYGSCGNVTACLNPEEARTEKPEEEEEGGGDITISQCQRLVDIDVTDCTKLSEYFIRCQSNKDCRDKLCCPSPCGGGNICRPRTFTTVTKPSIATEPSTGITGSTTMSSNTQVPITTPKPTVVTTVKLPELRPKPLRCPNPIIKVCDQIKPFLISCKSDSECKNHQACCPCSCTTGNVCMNSEVSTVTDISSTAPGVEDCPKDCYCRISRREECPSQSYAPVLQKNCRDEMKGMKICASDADCLGGQVCCGDSCFLGAGFAITGICKTKNVNL